MADCGICIYIYLYIEWQGRDEKSHKSGMWDMVCRALPHTKKSFQQPKKFESIFHSGQNPNAEFITAHTHGTVASLYSRLTLKTNFRGNLVN